MPQEIRRPASAYNHVPYGTRLYALASGACSESRLHHVAPDGLAGRLRYKFPRVHPKTSDRAENSPTVEATRNHVHLRAGDSFKKNNRTELQA
jgi:hypothetical protein